MIDDGAIFRHGSPRAHAALGADGCVEGGRAGINRVAASGAGLSRQREPSAD